MAQQPLSLMVRVIWLQWPRLKRSSSKTSVYPFMTSLVQGWQQLSDRGCMGDVCLYMADNGAGGHFRFTPLEKNARIFARDTGAKYFLKGSRKLNQSSKHLSQKVVMKVSFFTLWRYLITGYRHNGYVIILTLPAHMVQTGWVGLRHHPDATCSRGTDRMGRPTPSSWRYLLTWYRHDGYAIILTLPAHMVQTGWLRHHPDATCSHGTNRMGTPSSWRYLITWWVHHHPGTFRTWSEGINRMGTPSSWRFLYLIKGYRQDGYTWRFLYLITGYGQDGYAIILTLPDHRVPTGWVRHHFDA